MNKAIKNISGLLLLTFSASALADSSYFCMDTHQPVSVGDSMDFVAAACGEPSTKKDAQQSLANDSDNVLTQWVYTRADDTLPAKGGKKNIVQKPALTFSFQNGMLIQIDHHAPAEVTDTICLSMPEINHDNMHAVKFLCGKPDHVITGNQVKNLSQSVTVWTYNFSPYQPPMDFIFSDGKLTDIRPG